MLCKSRWFYNGHICPPHKTTTKIGRICSICWEIFSFRTEKGIESWSYKVQLHRSWSFQFLFVLCEWVLNPGLSRHIFSCFFSDPHWEVNFFPYYCKLALSLLWSPCVNQALLTLNPLPRDSKFNSVLVSAAAGNKSATRPPLPPPACGGEWKERGRNWWVGIRAV